MANYQFFTAIPASGNNPSVDQPNMQTNNASTSALIGTDHITFNAANGGQHKQITFNQDASYVPTPPVSPPVLFTNTVAGSPQLFYYSGDAAHSSNQYTVSQSNGSTFLLGGMILKWGQVAFSGVGTSVTITFTNAFPNNLFVVSSIPFGGSGAILRTSSQSVTGFTITRTNDSTSGLNIQWMAIGD